MVVYAVGEPYLLEVCLHCLELSVGSVAVVVLVYGLKGFPDTQVIKTKLVGSDIPTGQCCLTQIVYVLLLL